MSQLPPGFVLKGQQQPTSGLPPGFVLKGASRAAPQRKTLNDGPLSRLAAGAIAVGQGMMPVFDEAGATAGAALERAGLLAPVGSPDASYWDAYDQRLANIRGTERAFADENPYTDTALRLAGGVAGALTAPGIGAASAARPILTGAALGAGQGFTGAEGGDGNRIISTVVGGVVGAGGAALGKYVGDKLAGIGSGNVMQTPNGTIAAPNVGGRALNEIQRNLELGGITPEQYAQRLAASSVDDFAGELGGENMRMLAQANAKIPGAAMDAARGAMRQRIGQADQRVNQIINDTIASPDDLAQRLAQIEGKKAFEGIFYDAAKDIRIPSDAFEQVIATPAGQGALRQTAVNLANRNVEPNQIGILKNIAQGLETPLADGSRVIPELPVNAWHEVSKSLGDQVKRDIAGNIIEPANAAPIESMRKAMVDALRRASPEFDKAQTNSAAMRSSQEALDLGRKLARLASGDTGDAVLDATTRSPVNLPYAQAGYAEGLRDVISGVPYGGNPASRLANPKVINRTAELVGSEKAGNLYNKLLAEKLRMDFANRGINNSSTAETIGQMVGRVSDIPLTTGDVARKGGNFVIDLMNKGKDKQVASLLYGTSPEQKALLANMLLKSQSTPEFAGYTLTNPAQRRMMANLLTRSAPAIGAQSASVIRNLKGGE